MAIFNEIQTVTTQQLQLLDNNRNTKVKRETNTSNYTPASDQRPWGHLTVSRGNFVSFSNHAISGTSVNRIFLIGRYYLQ